METIKKYLNYIGLALAAILGIVVMVLNGRNKKLEASNANLTGKLAVGKDLNELEKQDAKAKEAERDLNDTIAAYRRDNPGDGKDNL